MLLQYKTRQFLFVILLLFITWPVQALERGPQGTIRVGVFPVEPLNFVDKQGVAQGLYPDLLREIVKDVSWTVEFVPGSWAEGLEGLQKGEIDLMLSVAYSPERAEIMDFSYESVAELWGQVFVKPEGKSKNINDLHGRRVAVMRKDIAGSNFIMTAEKLGVSCEIVEFATHAEVFTAVKKGAADAGVAPQHIGLRNIKDYNLVGSSIIFSPFSVFFASKKGMQHELLSQIDAHISNWKKDSDSFYYNRLNYWIGGQNPGTKIPDWLIYVSAIGVFLILSFVIFTVLLKRTVRVRTKELRESEITFRKLFEDSSDAILLIDSTGVFVECNQSALDLLKMTRDQFLLFPPARISPELQPDGRRSAEAAPEMITLAYSKGLHRFDWTCVNAQGSEFTVEVSLMPVTIKGQRMLYTAWRDITERKQAEEALQRSEEKFRQIITTVREGILSLDADWCITFANAHLAKMFGYDLDELLGQSFEVFLHEEDLEDFARRKHERQQGQYSQFERRFKTKDGREIWTIVSASAFEDDKGDFAGSFGTITDITERKRAEQMLRESEEQLSSIFRSAPIGIGFVVNRELMSINSRLCEMTGFDEGDLIGQSARILYPSSEDFDFVGREKYAQIRDHGTGTVETHWQRKDGTIIEILLSSTPIDMRDHSKGVTFTALDITERKQVERLLRDIIAKNPMSIQILDKDGLTIEANQAYKSLFGAVPPSGYSLFSDPQLLQMGIGELFDQLRNGATVSFPDTYFNAHDSVPDFPDAPAWVRAIGFPLNDGSGKPEKFVLMHENITERKEHEKEQLKNEKLESLGILAGGIAHDFNNILTAIMGNISLAKVFLESTHKSYTPLAEAEKASARAGELAHQLLTFARGGEPIKKVVAPQHLVNEAVSLMLRGSNVKAVINIHDSIHAIEADEGQMSQVFHNLIINATQAMPGGGTLTVTALNEILAGNNTLSLLPGTYIRLTFADQGCGISDDDLKRIFDPYFTTKSGGNGLGLASVHSIIKRHGGHIGVSSVVGKGTTFTIFLPSLGEIYTKFQTGIATQSIDRQRGGSLLVMDDEEMIRGIASSILTHLGYEVTTCAGGEEAVALYKNSIESGTPFLAVIMDLTIPGGVGGKEAAKQILSIFPKARLIVSSGYSNDQIMSSYREYGFSGAIAKPYNIHEVETVLNSLLNQ